MSLLDSNTRAIADECESRIDNFFSHFADEDDASWDDFPGGDDASLLETMKMDLTMLASVLEGRIQELGKSDQDFGT